MESDPEVDASKEADDVGMSHLRNKTPNYSLPDGINLEASLAEGLSEFEMLARAGDDQMRCWHFVCVWVT